MKINLFIAVSALSLLILSCYTTPDGSKAISDYEYKKLLETQLPAGNSGIEGNYPAGSVVARYGRLQIIDTQLCDEKGNKIQLNGVYLRALKEESKFLNDDCFSTLADKWKIDVIRIPFMSASWYSEPSYIGSQHYEQLIDRAVQLSEKYGIYCIIDWHVLGDGNPLLHAKESFDFFQRLAYKYGAKKHVLYEICNEPNGKDVTWDNVIKPYAELIIPAIKAGNPDAIVIVGTSTWSQDVDTAAKNPLDYTNILYAFHFYSGSHKDELRKKVEEASCKIPLFASEWGNSNYDAQGGPFIQESRKWMDMMYARQISWCHYALTDFPEDAAILKPNASVKGDWTDKDLTASGKFIIDFIRNR
jgi:endoglucanase